MRRKIGEIVPVQTIWVGKEGAKKMLECSDKYLTKLRNNAEISFARDGKMIWYSVKSINKFIESKRVI